MATIIRSGQRSELPSDDARAISFNFYDIVEQAREHLAERTREGEQLLEQARAEATQLKKAAQQEGRQEGEKKARAAVQQETERLVEEKLKPLREALRQAVAEMQVAKEDWLRRWEQEAVHLAAAMAQRVVRAHLKNDPEVPLRLVREALELAAGTPSLKIRLHPKDYEALSKQRNVLQGDLAIVANGEIVSDESVTPGGCIVSSEYGDIDQRIEAQLGRIEEELT